MGDLKNPNPPSLLLLCLNLASKNLHVSHSSLERHDSLEYNMDVLSPPKMLRYQPDTIVLWLFNEIARKVTARVNGACLTDTGANTKWPRGLYLPMRDSKRMDLKQIARS